MQRTLLRVAIVAAALGVGAPASRAEDAALVFVDAVRVEPLRQTVPVIGRLVACRAGVVAAEVDGAVAQLAVEVGDRVDRNQVLAVIDRDRYSAELDLQRARVIQAKAEVAAAEAEVALRRQELERIDRLRQSPAFNEGRFEDKRQEVAMADADVGRARAALASAEAQLRLAVIADDDTSVRAPYHGVVSRRHIEVGAHVDRGDPVVTLVDDRCAEIEADVPAVRIGGLVAGSAVTFILDDGRSGSEGDVTGSAVVRAVIPEENPLTRTRTVRFSVDLGGISDIAAGQSVVVAVPAGGSRDVATVHKDALLTRRGERIVFIVADGKAEPRPVRLGDAVGGRFEVLEGLAAGDLAVIRGNERLRPGQPVRIGDGSAAPAVEQGRADLTRDNAG